MSNEHPPRQKSVETPPLLERARKAREEAELFVAQSKQARGSQLSERDIAVLKQHRLQGLHEPADIDTGEEPQRARVIYSRPPEALVRYDDTTTYEAASLHAAATDAARVIYKKSGAGIAGDVPRRAPARPRFSEPYQGDNSPSAMVESRKQWLQWLRDIIASDSELNAAAEEYRKKKRIEDEPTEKIVIEEGTTQVSEGRVGDDRTMTVSERSERFRDAQAEVARAVRARSSETVSGGSRPETTGNEVLDRVLSETNSPTLVPEVTSPTLNLLDDTTAPTEKSSATRPTLPKQPEKPRGVRGWLRRVGYALGFLSTVGAGVGMYETIKGNAPSGVDTADNPNQIALIEQGDTADSADSADSGDTADSAVDFVDSTDTGAFESGDSSTTETAESGDTAVDSGDSNSSIDSRDSGDTADSSVDSTDSFDSGETASDSFTRGGTGEYRQDTADSFDSADSSGDTGLESGNETTDSADSGDSTESGDSYQDSTFDSTDSGDSADSFRDTRGGTGVDSADTALDSADSGVDSSDSTDTGSLDSTDSGNSRDSFGGTGFDNDSADSADTMFYGGTGFTGTDSGDSQGMDSSDSFDDTGADSRADSGDSGLDSYGLTKSQTQGVDTAPPDQGALDTSDSEEPVSVAPETPPPAPTSGIAPASTETRAALIAAAAAQDVRDHRTLSEYDKMSLAEKAAYDDARAGRQTEEQDNVVRTRIENGEGISQAMLRLGVPIEKITQALDSVEVVVGGQINTLRNILIDASEAKGNQIGMNIQQDPDGTIRGVEFYSVANPERILTGSEMAELAHFDALSPMNAERQIHTLEDQLDDLEPGTELYYSPLVIRLAETGGSVQVRHITDGEHYYELTPEFLSVLGVDFTKYDKSKKEFLHETPEAPLTRRLFRELAAKEGLSPINR